MKILKIINNNVVSACDEKGKEIVVMGKGLGFGKKSGDILDELKIEKKFSMPDESVTRLEELLRDIPYEYIQTANKIIAMAKEKYGMKLSKIIYITLTDHLNFAITRLKKGIVVENALLWEIKRFYQREFGEFPKSYRCALRIRDYLKVSMKYCVSLEEISYLTIHIQRLSGEGQE